MNHSGLKCLTILFLLIPAAAALSFNFTSFSTNMNNTDIICEGITTLASDYIQLTPAQTQTGGRATYAEPLHLWDRASGNLTDFTTHFSFVVDISSNVNLTNYGDGFTFLLVPNGSVFPELAIAGRLGLTGGPWNSTDLQLVAVEFDIWPNVDEDVDPPYVHVGIDIHALRSVTRVQWFNGDGMLEGREQEAWISYDSQSRNLSVRFTGFANRSSITQSLSHVVDLREYLPEFVNFGFSASTGGGVALQRINSWSFSSNPQVNVSETNFTRPGNNHEFIGLKVGGPVLVLAIGVLVFILWMWRKRTINKAHKMGDEFEKGSISKKFAYDELKAATDNFAEQHKLGEGGFGSVYKGFLKSIKSYVAVKRISSDSKQGINEFASEVKTISTLRHRNLVQLLGWCYERKELLLVYEFMPKGSLDFHLFKGKSLLGWATRFRIVNGLASALLYLHEEWQQYVVHRDIKASNIMLDANFNSRLGDFGLAKLVDHEIHSQTTFPAGTLGYMAPEYMMHCRASKETDVFSFGIVALEIATGQKSRHVKPDGHLQDLAEHVWNLHRTEKLLDAADPQLNSEYNSEEMEQLLRVGLWCAHPYRSLRPPIGEAIRVLKFEAQVPDLPIPDFFLSSCESSDVSITN